MRKRYQRLGWIPTFKEFMSGAGIDPSTLTDAEFEGCWAHYDEAVWRIVGGARQLPDLPISVGALNQLLAEDVIADHLGVKWVEQNIINSSLSDQARNYVGLDGPKLLKVLALHRVQELARRLYQLQSFSWFDSVLDGVRTRELSGAAFELDVLWILQIASPYVQTRKEVGVKGSDYDAFALMERKLVPVEAKAKDDRTPWSPKTVINTVKGAARQIPKNDTGLLFFRIPTAWVGPELEEAYADVLAEATRQTSRIGAIVTVIDKPYLKGEKFASVSRHLHFFATGMCPDHIWSFCNRLRTLHDSGMTQMAPDPPF
ncbi:hypothetical protein ACX27O_00075 [Micromonospora sp. SD19]